MPGLSLPQGREIKEGEVLLSAGSYHSPMHLITGEFRVVYPGQSVLLGRGEQRHMASQNGQERQRGAAEPGAAPGGMGSAPPAVYACRRGFDAAALAVVPLRRALEGLRLAG